jgi:glycosyltransferase involved in cell wall biosynthesis
MKESLEPRLQSFRSLPRLPLTALLLTWNETANIARTLAGLSWVPEVLVIDSGSTDGTLEILASRPNVRVLHRTFDSFASQCNFGLDQISSEWVLSLDADYGVPSQLPIAMPALLQRAERENLAGYSLPFRYCIDGQPLRGSLLPPRTCLYRTRQGRYQDEGHGHRVGISGKVVSLDLAILHDDRKPLDRWLASQQKYLRIEAANLLATPSGRLSPIDRLRKHTPLAPLAALLFCLVLRGGLFDGRAGLTYALQRTYAELLLLLWLGEQRSRRQRIQAATRAVPQLDHQADPTVPGQH